MRRTVRIGVFAESIDEEKHGFVVVEFHSDRASFTFAAEDHTESADAFYRICQDGANRATILTGAGGDFIPGIDFSSFGNMANPGVWSQVHDEGDPFLETWRTNWLSKERSVADLIKSWQNEDRACWTERENRMTRAAGSFGSFENSHHLIPGCNFLATVNSYSSSLNQSARASLESPKNEELHGPSSLAERRPVLFDSAVTV